MFSFQTLLKENVNQCKVFQTTILRKPRTRNSRRNDLEQNKMVVPSCQEERGRGRGGGEVSETGERIEK